MDWVTFTSREGPDVLQRYTWLILAFAIGVVIFNRQSAADDPPAQPSKDKDKDKDKDKAKADSDVPKHETVKVEKGPLTVSVTLKGTVQIEEAKELSVRFKTWTGQLIAQKAIEHGAAVKAGDILVEFESEKLDREIRDARQERELAQLAIRQADLEIPIMEKQNPLDLASAEREYKQAAEDMKRFLEIDRKVNIQSAEAMLKSANFYSEYSKDELKQLQKMYRDKDLTEETEQMILKRYKHSVEMSELFATFAKIDHERTVKIDIPRREESLKAAVEKSEIALTKARDINPLTLQQKKLALVRLRYDETKAKEHLAELEIDRAALSVKSPIDGLAYHGRFVRGQWMIPAGAQGPALHGVTPINPGDVFVTVLSGGKLTVRADAEEKELAGLKSGLTGKLTPTAFPEKKLSCEIVKVAGVPHESKFEVKIKLDDKTDGLVPGMTCSTRFVTFHKKAALTVPSTAVFEDVAEDTHYVYVPAKGGKNEKKTVKVGVTSGERVEIVEGLSEGDEILASKP
jgi:HlyD family secretion protein